MIDKTSAANIQSMLETIRAYQAQASGQSQGVQAPASSRTEDRKSTRLNSSH